MSRYSVDHELTIDELRREEAFLRDLFYREAIVINIEKGYISAEFVNQLILPQPQMYAAHIVWAKVMQLGLNVDKIVAIPDAGVSFGTEVSNTSGIPLAPGRKRTDFLPGSWRAPILIDEVTRSFTTGAVARYSFNGLLPGDSVFLTDDVVAKRDTASAVVNGFRQNGINPVGVGVYMTKSFQWRNDLPLENDFPIISAIEVRAINPDGSFELAPPHF